MPAEPLTRRPAVRAPDVAARPGTQAARARRLPVVSLGIISLFVLVAILAPLLSRVDPQEPVAAEPFQAAGVDGGRVVQAPPGHRPAGP